MGGSQDPPSTMFAGLIYRLKRKYGVDLTVQRSTVASFNPETGLNTVSVQGWNLKAIKLPLRQFQAFYPNTDKRYYGSGQVDLNGLQIFVELKDLPQGFSFVTDDAVTINGQRYGVNEISKAYEEHGLVFLTLSQAAGDKHQTVHVIDVVSNLNIYGGSQ